MPKKSRAVPLFATGLELAGLASMAIGLWSVAHWLAELVVGAGVLAIGVLMDPPRRTRRPSEVAQ